MRIFLRGNLMSLLPNHRRDSVVPMPTVLLLLVLLTFAAAVIAIIAYLLFWVYHHAQCSFREAGVIWVEGPSHFTSRSREASSSGKGCPKPQYRTMIVDGDGDVMMNRSTLCITSLTDAKSPSAYQRMIRCRDFDDLALQVTFPNLQQYADKHGYRFVDSSHLIDTSRPPAWSKIKAVQALLRGGSSNSNKQCEWVMWLDADILIMNSNILLESILPSPNHSNNKDAKTVIDLIVTYDRKYTANSGAWLIRNSQWSIQFLNDWWNMKSWVRRSGFSLSGDNAAFGYLTDHHLGDARNNNYTSTNLAGANHLALSQQQHGHIAMPARCNFNSFGVFMTQDQYDRQQEDNDREDGNEAHFSDNFYHKVSSMAFAFYPGFRCHCRSYTTPIL